MAENLENVGEKKCPACGKACSDTDEFCSKCGSSITFKPSLIYENYTRDRVKSDENSEHTDFIGANYDYYLKKFRVQDVTNSDATWNWPAFLFAPWWCFFRKQYVFGAIFIGTSTLLNYMHGFGNLISIGIFLWWGFMANHFYRDYVQTHVDIASSMNSEEKRLYYQKKGGTSVVALMVGIGIPFVINLLLN